MKITAYKLSSYKIALEKPFITALRTVRYAYIIRLSIYSGNKTYFGETTPTKAITLEDKISIYKDINILMKKVMRYKTLSKQLDILHNTLKNSTSATSAIDMALIQSKYISTKIKTAVTISLNEPYQMLEDAHEYYEKAYDILKIKVGKDDGKDGERISLIAENLPDCTILVDANQAWSKEQSLKIIENLDYKNIKLIEQPVKKEFYKDLLYISKVSKIPILADESAFNLDEVKSLIKDNPHMLINIKLMKCGGVSKAIEILEFCRSQNVKCMFGSMIEGEVSISEAIKLCANYADVIEYIDLDSPLLYSKNYKLQIIKIDKNIISL